MTDIGGSTPDRRGCHSKKRYAIEANEIAARAWKERHHWLRVYACAECGGYHLTHKKASPKPGWSPPRPKWQAPAKSARAAYEKRKERRRR